MKRKVWVLRADENGEPVLLPVEQAERGKKPLGAIVHEDTIPPTFNHADGKIYTSKSAMRKTYKALGAIEVGNDLRNKDGGFSPLYSRPKQESVRETLSKVLKGEIKGVRH